MRLTLSTNISFHTHNLKHKVLLIYLSEINICTDKSEIKHISLKVYLFATKKKKLKISKISQEM